MSTFRTQATLKQDGRLQVENIPFRAGDRVEVTISEASNESVAPKKESLMAGLRKIQIDGPIDFSTRVDENNSEGF